MTLAMSVKNHGASTGFHHFRSTYPDRGADGLTVLKRNLPPPPASRQQTFVV